jgi:DNA ligase-1
MIHPWRFTLGHDYQLDTDPAGWFMSEKLWDVRAYWDGKDFWSRGGCRIDAPDWFKAALPDCHLDGGIYAGRSGFYEARNAANYGGKHFTSKITFPIYDVPQAAGKWAERMRLAPTTAHSAPVAFRAVKSRAELADELQAVQSVGGEGLVLRCPVTVGYVMGRTGTMLKVK